MSEDEKPWRQFVSVGEGTSKWVLESQAEADLRKARQEPTDSATVTALRAKVAELEGKLADAIKELEHLEELDGRFCRE